MKKELKKENTKLSLGKMTVAKLRLSQQQMQLMYGGNATKPTTKPTVNNNSLVDDPNNPCTVILPTFGG